MITHLLLSLCPSFYVWGKYVLERLNKLPKVMDCIEWGNWELNPVLRGFFVSGRLFEG
jgi:hypothetical protein